MPIECLLDETGRRPSDEVYRKIAFPGPPANRPYIYINMVSTADGKIVIGEPGGSARGVGGPTDQILFRRLQNGAEAALIGGNTLRASQVIYPPSICRFVATRTGHLPLDNRFFTDAPERAFVIAPVGLPNDTRRTLMSAARLVECGNSDIDWTEALRILRHEHGVGLLLCEGGGTINSQLIRAQLADELFLTVAPKLKCGAGLPTIMGGEPFPPGVTQALALVSIYRDGGEIYLRYRIDRGSVLN